MEIKQFIEKAIEGGLKAVFENEEWVVSGYLVCWYDGASYPVAEILLDPLAWKAVGKVEGWSANYSYSSTSTKIRGWGDYMHQMINALAEGKTIEEYLKIL